MWETSAKTAFDNYADTFDRAAKREVDFAKEYAKALQAQEGLAQGWDKIGLLDRSTSLAERTFSDISIPAAQRAQTLFDTTLPVTQSQNAYTKAVIDEKIKRGMPLTEAESAAYQSQIMSDFGRSLVEGNIGAIKGRNAINASTLSGAMTGGQMDAISSVGGGDVRQGAGRLAGINMASGLVGTATANIGTANVLENLLRQTSPQPNQPQPQFTQPAPQAQRQAASQPAAQASTQAIDTANAINSLDLNQLSSLAKSNTSLAPVAQLRLDALLREYTGMDKSIARMSAPQGQVRSALELPAATPPRTYYPR